MKKTIIIMFAVVVAAMAAGNFYYTYQASKEARIVTHMAFAMERDGIIDQDELQHVRDFVRRQHSILFPGASHERLRRMHDRLRRMRNDYQHPVESRTYHALEVCISNKME